MTPRSCALLFLTLLLACDAEPQASPRPPQRPPASLPPAQEPPAPDPASPADEPPREEARTPAPASTFVGQFANRKMSLTLATAEGDTLEGALTIGRRPPAPARATLGEGGLRGEFTVGAQTFPFEARLAANGLLLTADGKDYRLERTHSAPPRAQPEVAGTKVNGTKVNGTKVNGTKVNGTKVNGAATLDEALLGVWVQGDPLNEVHGEPRSTFSFVSDGTYSYGRSQSADGVAITGQLSSGQVITGRWRTKAGELLTLPRGGAGWVRYAAYSRQGDRLTLTYADGREQPFFRP